MTLFHVLLIYAVGLFVLAFLISLYDETLLDEFEPSLALAIWPITLPIGIVALAVTCLFRLAIALALFVRGLRG